MKPTNKHIDIFGVILIPIAIAIIVGWSAIAWKAFDFDFVSMFKNLTKEHVSLMISVLIVSVILVLFFSHICYTRKLKESAENMATQINTDNPELIRLTGVIEDYKKQNREYHNLLNTYKEALDCFENENPDIENLRAILRYNKEN